MSEQVELMMLKHWFIRTLSKSIRLLSFFPTSFALPLTFCVHPTISNRHDEVSSIKRLPRSKAHTLASSGAFVFVDKQSLK
jgi:hypothetical protein